MKGKNSSQVLAGREGAGVSRSISSRKIGNGYIVSESTFNEKSGEYRSSETFSKDAPRIEEPIISSADGESTSLRETMEYLKGGQ